MLLLLVLLVRLLQQLLLLVLEFLLLLLPLLSLLIVRLPPRLRPAAQLRRGRGTVTATMTRSISKTTPSLTNRSQAHPLLALLLQQVPLLPPLVSKIPRLRSLQRLLALQRLLRVVLQLVLLCLQRLLQAAACRSAAVQRLLVLSLALLLHQVPLLPPLGSKIPQLRSL